MAATLAGARGYLAISEYAARLTQTQLKRLRAYFDRKQQRIVAPSEPTFRRVLQTGGSRGAGAAHFRLGPG